MSTSKKAPDHLKPRPTASWLAELKQRFAEIDVDAVTAVLRLINLGRELATDIVPFIEKLGLTEARFTIVMMIYRAEIETGFAIPSRLADRAGIGRAAMTQLLDALQQSGWIQRTVDPNDRRSTRITLQPRSRRRLEQFLPHHYERMRAAVDSLTPKDLTTLITLLEKVNSGS